ncbi:MAG: haloacid dehalogenase [Rhodospirillaceae bacterium]|nr:haloacid dehalogenase [Rhodospirillaceae bacterium]|tara:strand:+ start:105 stop:845 length:741 start_codon:yes stop_codon:yes gene_type:complete
MTKPAPLAPAPLDPDRYDAVTFDVYGTLIDWEPTILDDLADWAAGAGASCARADLLDMFDRARAHYQQLSPARAYPDVLRSAFAYVANDLGLAVDADVRERFAASVPSWPAYGDSVAALARLNERFRLGALTNMDNASFAASHERLEGCFDVVVTAERAGAYKPSLRHFVLGLTDLAAMDIPPDRVLHVGQSLRADVRPGNLLGLDTVFINRPGRGLGHKGFGAELAEPIATYPTMADFVADFLGN